MDKTMKLKIRLTLCAIAFLSFVALSFTSFSIIADIEFENASITSDWDLNDNGNLYPINNHKGQYKQYITKPAISFYTKKGGLGKI